MAIAAAQFEFAMIDIAWRYSGTDELYVPRARHNADLPKELPKAKQHDRDPQEHIFMQSRLWTIHVQAQRAFQKPGTKFGRNTLSHNYRTVRSGYTVGGNVSFILSGRCTCYADNH